MTPKWAADLGTKALLIIALVVVVAGFLVVRSCQSGSTAKTESKLATGQTGAAIESGHDAVQTVGNSATTAMTIQNQVKDATNAIDKAPVGHRNAAADRAACQLRSYRHSAKCVALLGPAP